MSAKYSVHWEEINKYRDAMEQGEPLSIQVLFNDLMEWKQAKVIVSEEPIKGGDAAGVVRDFAGTTEGNLFIKILEELPEDSDII